MLAMSNYDIVKHAFRLAGLIRPEDEPTGDDYKTGLDTLNLCPRDELDMVSWLARELLVVYLLPGGKIYKAQVVDLLEGFF